MQDRRTAFGGIRELVDREQPESPTEIVGCTVFCLLQSAGIMLQPCFPSGGDTTFPPPDRLLASHKIHHGDIGERTGEDLTKRLIELGGEATLKLLGMAIERPNPNFQMGVWHMDYSKLFVFKTPSGDFKIRCYS